MHVKSIVRAVTMEPQVMERVQLMNHNFALLLVGMSGLTLTRTVINH